MSYLKIQKSSKSLFLENANRALRCFKTKDKQSLSNHSLSWNTISLLEIRFNELIDPT
jgi:hypothetical protein